MNNFFRWFAMNGNAVILGINLALLLPSAHAYEAVWWKVWVSAFFVCVGPWLFRWK